MDQIRYFRNWFKNNYHELKQLNPSMPILLRTSENCMPAVTTELDFTMDDLLKFMIQNQAFIDTNGTISEARVEAAKAYLKTDWLELKRQRWASPGIDPEKPFLDHEWRSELSAEQKSDLDTYFTLKDAMEEQIAVVKSGPNEEFRKAENAVLQLQRIDLWCAGEAEVEGAVKHLLKLGQKFNSLEVDNYPDFITEYQPGEKEL